MNTTQLRRTQLSRIKQRNFVAKHAQRSGAGRHADQSSRHSRRQQRDTLRLYNILNFQY